MGTLQKFSTLDIIVLVEGCYIRLSDSRIYGWFSIAPLYSGVSSNGRPQRPICMPLHGARRYHTCEIHPFRQLGLARLLLVRINICCSVGHCFSRVRGSRIFVFVDSPAYKLCSCWLTKNIDFPGGSLKLFLTLKREYHPFLVQ